MSSSKRVLIVDDSRASIMRVRAILSEVPNYEVSATACNGAEAVSAYFSNRPDMVLMDIVMPVMDGITATRAIVARDPEAKILVMSSVAHDGKSMVEALKAGAKNVLKKPVDAASIIEALKSV